MLRKIFKYIFRFLLLIIGLIAIIGVTYLINPKFVENKAMDLFMPTINLNETQKNNIIVENPEVYELMQIACSLTKSFEKDENLINRKSDYYKDFQNHFSIYKDHELILKLEEFLKKNPYGMSQYAIRLLSLNYNIDNENKISNSNYINVSSVLMGLFKSKAFLIPENLNLIEDFAKQTNFKSFYKKHTNYYRKLENNYNRQCDFNSMKKWLESKFDEDKHSYHIVFSPLTGGFHNTMSFKTKDKKNEQNFMFVSKPFLKIDSLSKQEFEINASRMSRVVFTEIDHNYVNPITSKYKDELDKAMKNYKGFNSQKGNMYSSKYLTFNEYMTWGVFNLYALDTYSKENIDSIIKIQTDFITKNRKFHRFNDFNDELIKQYLEKDKPKIEELYPVMLDWIAKQ
jgi:hypothetical protein